jgi:hypothetical protein
MKFYFLSLKSVFLLSFLFSFNLNCFHYCSDEILILASLSQVDDAGSLLRILGLQANSDNARNKNSIDKYRNPFKQLSNGKYNKWRIYENTLKQPRKKN